ncbi:MAG: molybdopterin-dependent oxidoreductase, partial [Eggerthellaceae bacterium]
MTSTGGGGNPTSARRVAHAGVGIAEHFEPGCAQCFLPRMATFSLMYGGSKSGTTSMADSKYGGFSSLYFPEDNPIQTLVMWGTCTSYHAPSGSGRTIAELRAREQGLNMVVVDPRFTPDAAMADVWLPIRPGTDVALMMTWIRYIIENKLYDEDFCKRWTNLPYL